MPPSVWPYLCVHIGSLSVPLQRALNVSKAVGDEAGAVLPVPAVRILLHTGSRLVGFLREVPGHALGKQERRFYHSRKDRGCSTATKLLLHSQQVLCSHPGLLGFSVELGTSVAKKVPLTPVGSRNPIPGVHIPDPLFAMGPKEQESGLEVLQHPSSAMLTSW